MQLLNIQTMAKLSGVSSHTLRAWERRYGALSPLRTETNRRQYSYQDLDRVRLLKDIVGKGIPISQVARLGITELKLLLSKHKQELVEAPASVEKREKIQTLNNESRPTHIETVNQLIHYIKSYDIPQINNVLTYTRLSYGAPDFVLNIASPLFKAVGNLVAEGKFSISQEHTLSALVRSHIHQLIFGLNSITNPNLPRLALTTREGDLHEFGILLTQVLCVHEGYPVIYLGPSLPAAALNETLSVLDIKTVIIGSLPVQPEHKRVGLRDYIEEIGPDSKSEIWIGGDLDDIDNKFIAKNSISHFSSLNEILNRLREEKVNFLKGR